MKIAMSLITFVFLSYNVNSQGFLKKLKDRTMDKIQQKAEEKRLYEMNKRREEELRDCSFHPETTVCPSYIKRIAKSMAMVKAARAEHKNLRKMNAKPQWR